MARLWLVLVVAVVFFTVYALVDCILTDRARIRAIPKLAWVIVILLVPVIGGVLWLSAGKARRAGRDVLRDLAPDDDQAFLHQLGSDNEQEERIRRLEQELSDLDDDPNKEQ